MKKVISVFLACLMLLCVISVTASAASETDSSLALRFDDNGEFKIMLFADIQDDENVEESTLVLMREGIEKYNPDLVIFLGDNTVAGGAENQEKAIKTILAPCVESNTPFAFVFGNHDQEQGVAKEDLFAMYVLHGGGLNLTWDAPGIYGCGNSNLLIYSSKNILKPVFNLWLVDSGSSLHDGDEWLGYDYVREDQIEWYKNTADALKLLNGGKVIPSLLFQHIIVPEIYEAIYPALPFAVGDTYKDVSYVSFLPSFAKHTGFILEPPCPSFSSAGQFDAWVETGDILGTFYGHDHVNSFTATYKNIDITTVPSVGCSSYTSPYTRGFGLITLNENDLTDYDYEVVNIYDMALEEGSQICNSNGAKSAIGYSLDKFFAELLEKIHEIFISANLPF